MLINPYRFAGAYDTDAQAYITAVETADGQSLETGVKDAINAFVVGCKADGIWTAIKASCILAGARTLAGALVPLVGPAPTNNNFVSADYNRKTGLKGNANNKNLLTNYTMLASSAADSHHSVFLTQFATEEFAGGVQGGTGFGYNGIYALGSVNNYYASWTSTNYQGPNVTINSLSGVSRSSSSSFVARGNGSSQTLTQAIVSSPVDHVLRIFARNASGIAQLHTNARIAFYSNGNSLNLALLDARVTTLMNTLAAAIP